MGLQEETEGAAVPGFTAQRSREAWVASEPPGGGLLRSRGTEGVEGATGQEAQ